MICLFVSGGFLFYFINFFFCIVGAQPPVCIGRQRSVFNGLIRKWLELFTIPVLRSAVFLWPQWRKLQHSWQLEQQVSFQCCFQLQAVLRSSFIELRFTAKHFRYFCAGFFSFARLINWVTGTLPPCVASQSLYCIKFNNSKVQRVRLVVSCFHELPLNDN